ncbi:MAG: DUF4974 domain-containing protein [Arachidicoccus sp.]|nr:DUF4974 domain-containing protein [Arachidicoccus sp.]
MTAQRLQILFGKYLSETLSADEYQEFVLLMDNQENQSIIIKLIEDEFGKLTYEKLNLQNGTGYNPDDFFNKIMAEVSVSDTVISDTNASFRLKRFIKYAIAAILIFVFSATIILKLATKNENANEVAAHRPQATNNLPSAGNAPVLTLANGKQIVLNNTSGNIVAQRGNIQLVGNNGTRNISSDSASEALLTTGSANLYTMILPDGSKVWLNAMSSIKFPTIFTGKERVISISGEAYFEVAKDRLHPFIVNMNGTSVKVLGTHFNINAYKNRVATTLLEGSVEVSSGTHHMLIKPGETANAGNDIISVDIADIHKIMAWKNEEFYFDNDTLEEIMDEISKWYDVDIIYEGKHDNNILFAGSISRRVNLSDALKMIRIVCHVDYEINGRKIIIKK